MTFWNRRNTVKNVIGLLLLPVFMFLFLRWFEHRQVYFPSRSFRGSADFLGQPWEDVYLKASDGTKINGWFFPAKTNALHARLAVLLCHGNGGNLGDRLELYAVLLEAGVNVFAFDYRGYGRSSGQPSENGTYQDAEAAYQWTRQKGFADTNVVALGESLGGGVASELATRVPLGGLILQSTFTSIPDIGAELFPWLPVRRMSTIRYDTLSKLPRLRVPVLVLHSPADSIVGFHHGKKLFAAAHEPKWFREIAGDHNDTLLVGAAQYGAAIGHFFASLNNSRAPNP